MCCKVCKTINGKDSTFSNSVRQVNHKRTKVFYDLLVLKQKHDPCELLCSDPYYQHRKIF